MKNTKLKILYSLRIHIELQRMGFSYVTEMKNPQFPHLNCWVYEETPLFIKAFDALMEGAESNG